MKKLITMVFGLVAFGLGGSVLACGIQGTAVNKDGSKIDGTATVSTSWNGTKAYPRGGQYRLELGSSACGERVTVYLDGNNGQDVRVSGWTTVNFVRR